MFRKVDFTERTYQRKVHSRGNSAVCTLGQFFSAHWCLVSLCCRYLHRVTCH
eukprot:UN13724